MDEKNRWQVLGAQELPCVGQLAFCSLLIFLCSYEVEGYVWRSLT